MQTEINGPTNPAQLLASLRKAAGVADESTNPVVNVNSGNTGGSMSRWQWISVVGVGTFLIVPVVFWMMNLIGDVIPANTEAMLGVKSAIEAGNVEASKQTEAFDDFTAEVDDLGDEVRAQNKTLATVIEERQTADAEEADE